MTRLLALLLPALLIIAVEQLSYRHDPMVGAIGMYAKARVIQWGEVLAGYADADAENELEEGYSYQLQEAELANNALTHDELMAYELRYGIRFLLSHPVEYASLTWRKWIGDLGWYTKRDSVFLAKLPRLVWPLFGVGILYAAWRSPAMRPALILCAVGFEGCHVFTALVTVYEPRYAVDLVPFVATGAVLTVRGMWG